MEKETKEKKDNKEMKIVTILWVVLFVVCVLMAIHFRSPPKARADESTVDYQRQAIVELCDENAELSKTLDELVGINVISLEAETIILPTSHFFALIKEIAIAEKQGRGYAVLLGELFRENYRLKLALKQRTFRAERVR